MLCSHGTGIVATDAHLNLIGHRRGAQERRIEHDRATVGFDLAGQCVHVAVRVEYTAFGRVQRSHGAQGRLHGQRLRAVQACDALDLVGLAAHGQRHQGRQFAVLRRHDELAALVEGDMMALEEGVEQTPALHAQARLQRPRSVVQAGVDDLGVARRHAGADAAFAFHDGHGFAIARQGVATGQADRAGADNDDVEISAHGCSIGQTGRSGRAVPKRIESAQVTIPRQSRGHSECEPLEAAGVMHTAGASR